ncbi:pancreatic lipase-related protein 3, partial [Nephila pilipes]
MARGIKLLKNFGFFVFVCCILWGELAESQFRTCYPDKEQKCDVESADSLPWDTTIRFFLFTRKNPEEPEYLHMCNGTLPKDSNFNPKNKLYVFIPGFKFGTCELDAVPRVKDTWLEKGDYNVLLLDCTQEYGSDFVQSMKRVKKSSIVIAQVLKNIQ